MIDAEYDVAVVGAGISGLFAAYALKKKGISCIVLEALNRVGGRLRVERLEDFAPGVPLHVGAEFLHGKSKSRILDLVEELGLDVVELPEWPDRLFYPISDQVNSKPQLIRYEEALEKDRQLEHAVKSCCELKHIPLSKTQKKPDIMAHEYLLETCKISQRHFKLLDATFANDMGESYSNTGLDELIRENIGWTYGDEYLILSNGLDHLVDNIARSLNVKVNFPVIQIDYSSGKNVCIRSSNPEWAPIRSKRVLVTVPLGVLKDSMLEFCPSLPISKISAIHTIGFAPAVKVFIKLSRSFWPEDLFDIVCSEMLFPEIWTVDYRKHVGDHSGNPAERIVTFFAMGKRARLLIDTMTRDQMIQAGIDQLNQIFGLPNSPKPGTETFLDGRVFIWDAKNVPFTRGGYSYPTLQAEGARQALAQPVGVTEWSTPLLFFSGEACNVNINPCLHGAIETSEIAVNSILQSLQSKHSKL